ncbi:MAG: PAS domain S-box protein [Anaerolineae bacterium]|nr:PAS domain S-box protein [Anaerolineae bacterium]
MTIWLPILIIPVLMAAALSTVLALFLSRRISLPTSWRALPVVLVAVAAWMFTDLLTTITPNIPPKLLWHILQEGILIALPGLWLLFILGFSGEPVYRMRRWRHLLILEPALMITVLASTAWHDLYWQSWDMLSVGSVTLPRTVDGPAAIVQAVYTSFLMTAATALLLRVISESTAFRRKQAITLLFVGMLPWIVHYSAGFSAAPEVMTAIALPLSVLISVIVFIKGVNDLRTLRVVPMARKTVIDKLQDGIIVMDKRGQIVDFNPAATAILGHSSEALLGQAASDVFASSPNLHQNYQTDTLHRKQIEATLPDGPHYYDLQLRLLQDDMDQFTGHLVTLHDITEHKRVEAALETARTAAETASRTKSEFLANMSHELRTPLNVIIGYTDLTLMGTYGELSELQQERLSQVSENAKQLAALLTDLIDISRIEARDFSLNAEVFDPVTLLRDAVQQAEGTALQKGLGIYANIPETLPVISADARRLAQVLAHLLNNAIKFTTEGYLVIHAVTLQREDTLDFPVQLPRSVRRWLMFAIQDTGIGIPPSHQTAIFEGFRQVDGSHARRYQGSGLGLTVAHRFTQLMNGHIWIESTLNQGSTIYVLLPVHDLDQPSSQQEIAGDSDKSTPATPRLIRPQLN